MFLTRKLINKLIIMLLKCSLNLSVTATYILNVKMQRTPVDILCCPVRFILSLIRGVRDLWTGLDDWIY
jgi:hypothetical protein